MFEKAIELIDAANRADPNQEAAADGVMWPKELLYSQRMSEMLERYAPESDDVMKLAVRAQHIERWKSPRSDYPEGRQGYLKWRTDLYKFHAETAAALLARAGYPEQDIERLKKAVGERGLKVNHTPNCWRMSLTWYSSNTTCCRLPKSTRSTTKRSGWTSSARPGRRCLSAASSSRCPGRSGSLSPWCR